MPSKIISIDPGPKISGLAFLVDGQIASAQNAENVVLLNFISDWRKDPTHPLVLIEDVKPYSSPLKQSIIDTIKWIGVLEYRLKELRIDSRSIPRSEVRAWIFERFPDICRPRIEAKIKKKGFFACDRITRQLIQVTREGKPWKPRMVSHIYVDDRVVVPCMKEYWQIETPKPGKTNRLGISKHAWQALALGTMYIERGAK